MSRLKEKYLNEIKDEMQKKFEYKNVMQIPKLDKIVINMGVGEAKENAKILDTAVKDLETITGQKAVVTRAKNSVANFKLREGQPIGCKVTLRGERMYEFLDRLVNLALPRVRDLEVLIQMHLMEEETTLLVLKNRLFSQKSNTIRLIRLEVWTLSLLLQLTLMKKLVNYWHNLTCHLQSN